MMSKTELRVQIGRLLAKSKRKHGHGWGIIYLCEESKLGDLETGETCWTIESAVRIRHGFAQFGFLAYRDTPGAGNFSETDRFDLMNEDDLYGLHDLICDTIG
jgi:hypothetical protein